MNNPINVIILFALPALFVGYIVGMNIYVRIKVKRRMRDLERYAAMSCPASYDWKAWSEEMEECKEWLHHGWPEPGSIWQGPIIGKYGFPYVRGKRRVRF